MTAPGDREANSGDRHPPSGPGDHTHGGGDPVTSQPAVPIIVIDDHRLFAVSLLLALREAGMQATALPVSQVTAALEKPGLDNPVHPLAELDRPGNGASATPTGLVLLDLNLGTHAETGVRLNGAHLISALRERGWHILVVTASDDPEHLAEAIAAGALGVVEKTDDFERLRDAARLASTGQSLITEEERQRWLDLDARYSAERRDRAARLGRLTPRERAVLGLIAEGHRAAAIADHFVVSVATVRAQIRSILTKTNATSQLEAVALYRRHSID